MNLFLILLFFIIAILIEINSFEIVNINSKLDSSLISLDNVPISKNFSLSNGIPTKGSVSYKSYSYYQFIDSSNPSKDVLFDLLPTTGDADLFVSCSMNLTGNDYGFPSRKSGHYDFQSQRYSEDTLSVSSSDSKSCSSNGGIFYIAIYGYSEVVKTEYTLTVTYSGGVKTLLEGIPSEDKVLKGLNVYFTFHIGKEAEEVTFTVTPFYGDSDIFIKMDSGKATTSDYDEKSNNLGSVSDTITISESSVCTECDISILVYGFETSKFAIVVTMAETTITLTDGLPQSGSVDVNKYQFYSFVAPKSGIVYAGATVFTGFPTVYLSKSAVKPTKNTPNTRSDDSLSTGNQPVVSMINIIAGQNIYISVYGSFNQSSSYTIRASITPSPYKPYLLTLLSGIAQSDSIPYDLSIFWKYYQISVEIGHEALNIRHTELIGSQDLYVTRCPSQSQYGCTGGVDADGHKMISYIPNSTHYLFTTENGLSSNSLVVTRNDKEKVSYIIGVKSLSSYSVYQLSIGFDKTILSLVAGISVMDHVSVGEIDYFSFYLDKAQESFKIVLTPISGDPDLYISRIIKHPNAANNTWHSFLYGADTILIDPAHDLRACTFCIYYIAVVGTIESTYSITASTYSTVPHLIDGVPMSGTVSKLGWTFYTFYDFYGDARDLKIQLTPSIGNPDVYVTLDGTEPTWLNYDYKGANGGTSEEVITILHTDSKFSPCFEEMGCQVRIGVYGFSSGESDFSISVTTSSTATMLLMGHSHSSLVAYGADDYYSIDLHRSEEFLLHISLTIYSGHVLMYLNCDDSVKMPSEESYKWILNSDLEYVIDIASFDITSQGCTNTMYLNIKGVASSAYDIIANFANDTSLPYLTHGVPITSKVNYKNFEYYILPAGSSFTLNDDIRIRATELTGHVQIYISLDWATRPYFSTETTEIESYLLTSLNAGGSNGGDGIIISHDLVQDLCEDKSYCFLVIGVYGSYDSLLGSSYRLLATLDDSTVTLSDGVAFRGTVSTHRTEFFKYSLSVPNKDVVFSVTPIVGDVDMYISMSPQYHPSRFNFTWAAAAFGADTITIQAKNIIPHCVPNPIQGKHCDFYIGVYAWINASYTILAITDDGFKSPTTLIEHQSQTGSVNVGQYKYYKFIITAEENVLPQTISISATPTDAGDLDMFVTLAEISSITNDAHEPGKDNYKFRSIGWSSVSEEIDIKPGMDGYCVNCIVYIAIYGYTATNYIISATTSGMTMLIGGQALGGHVDEVGYKYYTFYNNNPFAVISITVTTVTGDADLYIGTYKKNDEDEMLLPSYYHFTWRSFHWGDDVMEITYQDDKFCYDCDYVIGVYGYRNTSFTVLATESEATIIKLSLNKPQLVTLTANKNKYFSIGISNSADNMRISLTPLNTGWANIYVQIYNSTMTINGDDSLTLPDPLLSSTYLYSSVGTEDDWIIIPGPYSDEMIIVACVHAVTDLRFNIVGTTSIHPILLQSGIPQNAFVTQGRMEYFVYYPSDEIEDVQITLSARTGDPDLFVTCDSNPNHLPVCESNGFYSTCFNYTWSSSMFQTDQIIISSDEPCSSVISSTHINPTCDPATSYQPGRGFPIKIGVYGFKESKFTIMIAATGQRVQLLAGQPQLGTTSLGFICTERSSQNGACLPSSSRKENSQIAYFSFLVSDPGEVGISVMPNCNISMLSSVSISDSTSIQSSSCQPGCDCEELIVHINSCVLNKCTELEMMPSSLYGQSSFDFTVDIRGTSQFISPLTKSLNRKSVYCDPLLHVEGCQYFISVERKTISENTENIVSTFSIVARTPGDLNLIPCVQSSPDGVNKPVHDSIPINGERSYELCASSTTSQVETISILLEQCTGETNMYACADGDHCDDLVPTSSSWSHFADSKQSCERSYNDRTNSLNKKKCFDHSSPNPILTMTSLNTGNYYMLVTGIGEYELHVSSTINKIEMIPHLIQEGKSNVGNSNSDMIVKLNKVDKNTVSLSWPRTLVLLPGMRSPVVADYLRYTAIYFEPNKLKSKIKKGLPAIITSTLCGLTHIEDLYPGTVFHHPISIDINSKFADSETITYVVTNLPSLRNIEIRIVATCDEQCIIQLNKEEEDSTLNCGASSLSPCKSQSVVYDSISVKTGEAPYIDPTGEEASEVGSFVKTSFFVLCAIVFVLTALYMLWYKMKKKESEEEGRNFSITEMVESVLFKSNNPYTGRGNGSNFQSLPTSSSHGNNSDSFQSDIVKNAIHTGFSVAGDVFTSATGKLLSLGKEASSSLGSKYSNHIESKSTVQGSYKPLVFGINGNDDEDAEVEVSL